MVGSDVDVTADGLAKGENYTVRLDGKPIMTGKANKKGDVARTFELAKTTAEGALELTITGSNPSRVGSAVLTVIKPKELSVEVDQPKVEKKSEITLTVTGLLEDEPLTVMYLGKKLTDGDGRRSRGVHLHVRRRQGPGQAHRQGDRRRPEPER